MDWQNIYEDEYPRVGERCLVVIFPDCITEAVFIEKGINFPLWVFRDKIYEDKCPMYWAPFPELPKFQCRCY